LTRRSLEQRFVDSVLVGAVVVGQRLFRARKVQTARQEEMQKFFAEKP